MEANKEVVVVDRKAGDKKEIGRVAMEVGL